MNVAFLEGQEYEAAVKAAVSENTNMGDVLAALPDMDMGDRVAAFIEMRDFARSVLELALARGGSLGFSSDDDIVESWEKLTGEVYGEDYCKEGPDSGPDPDPFCMPAINNGDYDVSEYERQFV